MKLKRLFVGINIPQNIREKLMSEAQDDPEFGLLPVRWTDKDNLHITLEFLGYADDEQSYEIAKRLHSLIEDSPSFPAFFDKIVFGPPDGLPEMIWAVGPKNEYLTELHKNIRDGLSDMRLLRRGAKHKFSTHITLGRLSKSDAKEIEKRHEKEIRTSFPVLEVTLMESFKENNRTYYAILETVKLGEL